MPKIPRYSAQGSLSGKADSAYVEQPEWITSGMKTGVGEALTGLGEVGAAFMYAREVQERNDLITQLHTDKDASISQFAERSDYGKFNEDLKASQSQRISQYRETYPVAFKQLEKKIALSFEEEGIKVRGMGRKLMAQDMEARWDNQISNVLPQILAKTDDPEERSKIIADAQRMTEEGVKALYINPVKAEKKFREFGSKADYLKFKENAKFDVDEAQVQLAQKETYYPNMTADDEQKAWDFLDKRRRQIEIEEARAQKEAFKDGAQKAYDNMRLWKQGKFPNFEDWLDKNRGVTISEQTYQAGINKIEHARTRSVLSQKMSGSQKQKFYEIQEKILLGDPSVTQDDIMKLNLPDAKENVLMNLIIKPRAVKSQISITNRRIEGTMRESEADEVTKENVRSLFADRVRGVADPEEVRRIGEDVVKSLPQSGWGKPKTAPAPSKPSKGQTTTQPQAPSGTMIPDKQGGFTFKKGKK